MRRAHIFLLGFVSACLFVFSAFGSAPQEIFTLNVDPSDVTFKKAEDYDRVKLPEYRFPAETDGAECKNDVDGSFVPGYFQAASCTRLLATQRVKTLGGYRFRNGHCKRCEVQLSV